MVLSVLPFIILLFFSEDAEGFGVTITKSGSVSGDYLVIPLGSEVMFVIWALFTTFFLRNTKVAMSQFFHLSLWTNFASAGFKAFS